MTLQAAVATAQLSPGELSDAHAHLEGSSRCLDCHAPRQGVAPKLCLDCHGALRLRVAAGAGLHAQPGFERCESCHIEHHGREFELIYWDDIAPGGRDAFDHAQAGWPLKGAHADASCRDCHRPENLQDPASLRAGSADLDSTFLGLSTTCASCHADEHRGQFAPRGCSDCHTTEAWAPASGFDHSATAFPLVGSHDGVACASCHDVRQDGAETFRQFTDVAHSECSDCHGDPHRGRLGPTCTDCHSPTAWRRVERANFDHSRTRFPLTGLHRRASCQSCHRGGATSETLAFASCSDCHSDPHRGRLGPTCSSCHDTSGWSRVDQDGFDHDRTRFPLRGLHANVDCAACHTSGRMAQDLDFDACSDCHGDPHRGQLRFALAGGEPRACAECHDVHGFVPSSFGVEDHQSTPFPLTGAHLAIACVDCHLMTEPEALAATLGRPLPGGLRFQRSSGLVRRFRFSATSCESCHGDPHDGATGERVCSDCHSTSTFRHVDDANANFDHGAATGFPLAGGHADIGCAACHDGRATSSGATSSGATSSGAMRFDGMRFDDQGSECASCHADPHFGSGPGGGDVEAEPVDCASCHRVSSWRDTTFVHHRDAGFALEGAHSRLDCASCHVPHGTRVMKPPTTCEGCHGVDPGDSGGSFMSSSSSTR